MLYEICVNITTGAIGSSAPAPFPWKPKECSGELSIIEHNGTLEEVAEITSGEYRWINEKFIHSGGEEFDPSLVFTKTPSGFFFGCIHTSMLYEICINITTGAIGSSAPAPFPWKPKECSGELSIIEHNGTLEEVAEITSGEYRWINEKS